MEWGGPRCWLVLTNSNLVKIFTSAACPVQPRESHFYYNIKLCGMSTFYFKKYFLFFLYKALDSLSFMCYTVMGRRALLRPVQACTNSIIP